MLFQQNNAENDFGKDSNEIRPTANHYAQLGSMTEVNNAIQFLTDYATQNNLNYSEDEILSVVIISLFTNSHVRDKEFRLNQDIPNDVQTFYNNTVEKFGGILQIFRIRENINKND